MAIEVRPSFTLSEDYVARKEFKFSTRELEPGDHFPWQQLGCSTRRLRQLYNGRMIDPSGEPVSSVDEVPKILTDETSDAGSADKATEGETTEDEEIEDEEEEDLIIFDPRIHEIDNPQRGKWAIMKDGEKVVDIRRKLGKMLVQATEPVKLRPDSDGDLEVVE